MKSLVVLSACLLLSGLPACSEQAAEPKASATTSAHGAADAVPGSHADWCGEHEVPESKCTRCDSSLIAAFKATGDWCPEHGLPESQCVTCDPSRKMTRPPAEAPR
jgi:hypothetical protein